MDLVTLALQLANKMADIILLAMEGQPPEVRKQLWENYAKRDAWWQAWFDKIGVVLAPPKP